MEKGASEIVKLIRVAQDYIMEMPHSLLLQSVVQKQNAFLQIQKKLQQVKHVMLHVLELV